MSDLSGTDKELISREVFDDISDLPDARKPPRLLNALHTALRINVPDRNPLKDDLGKLGTCRALLEKDPELFDRIQSAIQDPTRLFELLEYDPIRQAARSRGSPNLAIGGDQEAATIGAWSTPYAGPAANLLKRAIDDMNDARSNLDYANFVAIVQSSGTGKSRAVDQVAQQVFTIPFNLRPLKDMTGFPKGDGMDTFLSPAIEETASALRVRYTNFFCVLFDEVRALLGKFEKCDSPEDLAAAFYDAFSNIVDGRKERNALYQRVVEKVGRLKLAQAEGPTHPGTDRGASHRMDNEGAKKNSQDAEQKLQVEVKTACDSLVQLICKKSSVKWDPRDGGEAINQRGPVRLLIYFDEAHPLTSVLPIQDDKQAHTAYQILCSVLNDLSSCELFAIFLSTSPRISSFAPAQEVWSASRGRNDKTQGIQAPFVELPFDLYNSGEWLSKENTHTLDSVTKPEFMIRFGRPLFGTRYRNGDIKVKENIVKFARMKLAGITNERKLSEDGQLAVLSTRIGLSFNPSREAARAAQDRLVEGHMRIAYSVPGHRECMRAGTPSEPILAEAAAQLMWLNGMMTSGVPEVLVDGIENGLISKGERGAVVARFLLTRGHDIARLIDFKSNTGSKDDTLSQSISPIQDNYPAQDDSSAQHDTPIKEDSSAKESPVRVAPSAPPFSNPISLGRFLEALVGQHEAEKIFNALPDNQPNGTALRDSPLGSAMLNFTHWSKASDDSVMSDEAAWIALCRCTAWQCYDQQQDVDLITPLALWDKKLGRWTVSAIFWQIKNRMKNQSLNIDAEEMRFFSPHPDVGNEANRRPYLTVILNLDVQTKTSSRSNKRQKGPTTPPSPSKHSISSKRLGPSREAKATSKHPRYALTISGCSNTVYPNIIGPNEKHKYAGLLASRTLLDEHPRRSRDFLASVIQMKPAWQRGEGSMGSYAGFGRDEPSRLGAPNPVDELVEGLKVHSINDPSDAEV